ncbi:uncharacterized protein LOC128675978 isoform X2 [Plodia interpunctella]|uniref:uncharacterized protein LOC128675978 isoform X2 n=1 Tax=Plodia interpunctella TaxID=58824 RepID=UPI002367AD0F|nr:uncharacterized protein LOC128675978 isoform X2 [Plodia interpunctella]
MEESKKGVKRKRNTNLDSKVIIDNTAPLTEVIHDLYHRETTFSKPYRLYYQLLGQRRYKGIVSAVNRDLFHFALPGHPLNAFTDNYDGEIDYCYFEKFPYKSLLPKYITNIKHQQKEDPITDLLKRKHEWRYKIHKQKTYSYNWYYAGNGNLQLVCVHWMDYLLHSEFNCVSLTRFHKDNLTIDYDDTTSFYCNNNILETICSSNNTVAVRTAFKIFILKIIENDGKVQLEKLKSFDSELPFTSISFDKVHTNILYVTDLNCKLTIINIDRITGRCVNLKKCSQSIVNNWNTVIGVSRGIYMHVDKKAITGYDKRTHVPIDTWDRVADIVDETDCNALSAVFQVEDSPNLYFTTEHHLFLMDSRCSKKNKLKVVQRWTHGMQCVPTYISIRKAEVNKELVILSSQWCEDMCVVSSYADRLTRITDVDGVAIPYRPPNIFNTLSESRQKLLCMDMNNPVDNRLAYSISGKIEVDIGSKFAVLMQNSVGDISSHLLYPLYMEDLMDDDAIPRLDEWAKLYKVEKKPFEVTGIYNFRSIWKKLRKMPDSFEGVNIEVDREKPLPSEKEILDVFRNEEIMPELLDAWDDITNNPDQSYLDLNINVQSDGE